jgi:predicted permease
VIEAGLPLTRGGNTGVSVNGGELRGADFRAVTPELFATLGVPLRQGRYLDASDRAGGEPVIAVNEAFVHRYLNDRDPLGTMVTVGDVGGPRRVVGVVGDVTSGIGRDAPPTVFIPASQEPAGVALAFNGWFPIHVLVRTTGDPASVSAAVARAVRATDPHVPVGRVRTMGDVLAESLALRRFVMTLLSLFAGLAVVLAAVGIYGLMSYLVTQRAREFGIRMALGARPGDVMAMVVRRAAALVGPGIVLGVLAAAGLTRLLASQLFGVRPIDPATFAAVLAGIVAVALVACSVPAWRGTKVDPVVALRYE